MTGPSIPKTATDRGKIAPVKLAHVVLRTQPERVAELSAWYQAVLEADVVFGNPFLQFLTYDDEHHRIAIVAGPGLAERPVSTVGVDHVAFSYAGLRDLVQTYERLKAQGIEPAICIHHGPTLSMYYRDPDRNQVELQIDVFETHAEIDAYLKSAFQKNPIGVQFDPDDLVERFHAGVPEAELMQPLEGPPPAPDAAPPH
jgi:catechol-2,3-dioxygenase